MELSIFQFRPIRKILGLAFILLTLWAGCSEPKRVGGTDIETDIEVVQADLYIIKDSVLQAQWPIEFYFAEVDTSLKAAPEPLLRLLSDDSGRVFLPDSIKNRDDLVIYSSKENSSLWIPTTETSPSDTLTPAKEWVVNLVVQSESVYGGGEADSALFILAGTPLYIQCNTEPKWIENWPSQAERLSIINKYAYLLNYELPVEQWNADTLYMRLEEETLIVQTTDSSFILTAIPNE